MPSFGALQYPSALYIVQRQRSCLIHLCTLGAATLRTTEHSISSFPNGASQRTSVTFCPSVFTAIFPLVKMTPKDILWVQNKIICVPWNSNLPHRFFFSSFGYSVVTRILCVSSLKKQELVSILIIVHLHEIDIRNPLVWPNSAVHRTRLLKRVIH